MMTHSDGRHAPKLLALTAREQGELSGRGMARIDAHLQRCGVCRDALDAMRRFESLRQEEARFVDALVSEMSSTPWTGAVEPLPEAAHARARVLRAVPRRMAPRGIAEASVLGFALAALLPFALTFFVARPNEISLVVASSPRTQMLPATGRVTAISGDAFRLTPAGWLPLALGDALAEGDLLRTGPAGALHVSLADGAGWHLGNGSELWLGKLRADAGARFSPSTSKRRRANGALDVALVLRRGVIVSMLPQPGRGPKGTRYQVQAGAFDVAVRGTLFSVRLDDGALSVQVDRGRVALLRDGRVLEELTGPSSFGVERAEGLDLPHLPATADPVAQVVLRGTGIDRWAIDGRPFPTSEKLELLLQHGVHQLRGYQLGRLLVDETVTVAGPLDWANEGASPRTQAPARRYGVLLPSQIAPVIRGGMSRLRACQALANRQGADVSGLYALHLVIDRTGQVESAQLRGGPADPPDAFHRCVAGNAMRWIFPPPKGGVVLLRQPVRFTTR